MLKTRNEELENENAYLRKAAGIPSGVPVGPPPQYPGEIADKAYYGVAGQLKQESPEETIDYLFTFHDNPDKTPHYIEIREAAKVFAKAIIRHCPSCADRTFAIRKVREAVMTANAAVALDGRGL